MFFIICTIITKKLKTWSEIRPSGAKLLRLHPKTSLEDPEILRNGYREGH